MIGTSIGDLNKNNLRNSQDIAQANYEIGQSMQYEQGHNAAHQMHQAQQIPYYDMSVVNKQTYPQFINYSGQPIQHLQKQVPGCRKHKGEKMEKGEIDIEELAKDINDNLTEDTFTSIPESTEDQHQSSSLNLLSSVPTVFKEPLIILILFIILSQSAVKDTLGK